MAVDTTTQVEAITNVEDDGGNKVPPASDADYIARLQGADIGSNGSVDVEPDFPGRAKRLVVLVEADAAFTVTFRYEQSDGTADLTRGPNENSDLESTDGSQLFVVHTPADAAQVAVRIADTSGGANTVSGRVYVA